MFRRYSLRTLDVDAARAFYTETTGLDFSIPVATSGIEAWPLHEQARARGAPSHWLGHLAVPNLDATLTRLLELGAARLGPTVTDRDGIPFATLRDPIGAVMAIRETTPAPEPPPVAWSHLSTTDADRASKIYAELFGWDGTGSSIANTARAAGVHTHWLYCFPIADLDASVALVKARGGKALDPVAIPNGRLAACEDPQGAAFGLFSHTT